MKEIIERLVDDLDGKSTADRTVSLAVNGSEITLDLTQAHFTELMNALAPYLSAGAKVATTKTRAGRSAASGGPKDAEASARTHLAEIRAARDWLTVVGKWPDVPSRGRLPQIWLDRYRGQLVNPAVQQTIRDTEPVEAPVSAPPATFSSPTEQAAAPKGAPTTTAAKVGGAAKKTAPRRVAK